MRYWRRKKIGSRRQFEGARNSSRTKLNCRTRRLNVLFQLPSERANKTGGQVEVQTVRQAKKKQKQKNKACKKEV